MKLTGWAMAALAVLFLSSATAHTVKWTNGHVYDYAALLKGKNCCSSTGQECRPLVNYHHRADQWELVVPKDGNDLDAGTVVAYAFEKFITWQDLARDGVAHACIYYDPDLQEYRAHCTFLPPGRNAYLGSRVLK